LFNLILLSIVLRSPSWIDPQTKVSFPRGWVANPWADIFYNKRRFTTFVCTKLAEGSPAVFSCCYSARLITLG